jgi:hypothetical protein
MQEILTEELLSELLIASNPEEFLEKHAIGTRSLSEYLQALLEEKGLRRIDVIRGADLNETFGYQIFVGQRKPSRNKILQIALAMGLTLQETNRLLQAGEANALYCKDRRDAIILFCIKKHYPLHKVNEELYRFGEDTIC